MKTRNIREVKVGDRIQTDERHEIANTFLTMRVEEVLENCLGYQYFGKEGFYWMTFDELDEKLEDGVWELKRMTFNGADRLADAKKPIIELGVDDSEEVEFTKAELQTFRSFIITAVANREINPSGLDKTVEKLNKMLRNK